MSGINNPQTSEFEGIGALAMEYGKDQIKIKRKTCAGCKHLEKTCIAMGAMIFGCSKTGKVVPHRSQRSKTARAGFEVTFWRVPLECPLPDEQAEKRKKIVALKDQVTEFVPL